LARYLALWEEDTEKEERAKIKIRVKSLAREKAERIKDVHTEDTKQPLEKLI
jgi:hypothetical protein